MQHWTEILSVFDHLVGLALKGLTGSKKNEQIKRNCKTQCQRKRPGMQSLIWTSFDKYICKQVYAEIKDLFRISQCIAENQNNNAFY